MKAAFITELGSPDNIQIGDLIEPTLGTLDVLVRTQALAVNFVDTLVRSGRYPTPKTFPFVIGRDVVGVVAAKGDAVDGFQVGDLVWSNSLGHRGLQGSFSEYVAVPSARLYPLPEGADPIDAVALLHAAGTAHLALFREAGVRYGETVVVSGAGGAVGSTAVQFAAASGAHVIATASDKDADWCSSSGAEVVFDYRDPELRTRIAAKAPNGVDVYLETSRHYDFTQTLPLLAPGGRFVLITSDGSPANVPLEQLYLRDASLRGFTISTASVADLAEAARAINDGISRRLLRVRIATELSLEESVQAHRLMEEGARGRIVVLP
ncbi:MAG TPA: NADPH:quinone reductase [Acidimicrobiales bacterium]|nr:NADPH:quinone reductase [Acidimicrobiales bacterium]